MKSTFVGVPICGNFKPESQVNLDSLSKVNKIGTKLYLIARNSQILLLPIDSSSELVVDNFSSRLDNENETIYELKVLNNIIVIIVYTFLNVQRIELPSETIHFYLDRLEKKRLEEQEGVIDDIKFLIDEFVNNRSIFAFATEKNNFKSFQIVGNSWKADCEKERAGVYRIKKLIANKSKNNYERLIQVFGYIKFVSYADSFVIKGNDYNFPPIKTNDIFIAWDAYVDFEKTLYDEEVLSKGFERYLDFRIEEDEIVFTCDKSSLKESLLFSDSTTDEFDLILYLEEDKDLWSCNDIKKLIEFKNKHHSLQLRKCINHSFATNELRFNLPTINVNLPKQGFIVLSDASIRNEIKRRKSVKRTLDEKKNATANMLMRLTAGDEDHQTGSNINPLSSEVLEMMFGDKSFQVTNNYREALNIALNTPDIAVIQGPPGTGKTTLINGIISRLNLMGKRKYKIHVATEQHEALYNVVNKLAVNKLIPPFVASRHYSEKGEEENSQKFGKTMTSFKDNFIKLCNEILEEKNQNDSFSECLSKVIFILQDIKINQYNLKIIVKYIDNLSLLFVKMGVQDEFSNLIFELKQFIGETVKPIASNNDISPEQQRILKKIIDQRIIFRTFYDDNGKHYFNELNRVLLKYGYESKLLSSSIRDKLLSDDVKLIEEIFPVFVSYVESLKNEFSNVVKTFHEDLSIKVKDIIEKLYLRVREISTTRHRGWYEVIDELRFRLFDEENSIEIIRNYTNIIGTTCAQSKKGSEVVELEGNKFDYVIIDEAARANPLDLMLPLLMGIKVIIVGDQMQLPHYIENRYVKKFLEEKNKYSKFDEKLLQTSLFEIIYNALEKSYEQGKINFKRHIMIQEQHRMPPTLGDFISAEFYGGEIIDGKIIKKGRLTNGKKTINHLNHFGLYNGKNIAWIDVPLVPNGLEEEYSSTYRRQSEADKVFEIIKKLFYVNKDKKMNIGIISFYKGQVELMNKILNESLPREQRDLVNVGTVDSYQGQEFDIVILSTVRSNAKQIASESLGFIHYSRSRINVALSRAKKLLIVVGNKETFSRNPTFRNLIHYIQKVGAYE